MENYTILYNLNRSEIFSSLNRYKLINWSRPRITNIMESNGVKLTSPKHLLYFKKPKKTSYPLDLNDCYEDYKFRDPSVYTKNLNKIEKHMIEKKNDDHSLDTECMAQICTHRSVLWHIMITPYRLKPFSFNNYTIYATKFQGIIYLELESEDGPHQKRNTYHFKYRQCCFSDSPSQEPITSVPVDENYQIFCVYEAQLGNFNILYSSETSGILSQEEVKVCDLKTINKCRFVHTKICREKERDTIHRNNKLLQWWLQSFLVNVDDIYIGFFDKNGHINLPMMHLRNQDLPKNQYWKPDICNQFLHKFLTTVQEKMANVDCPNTVYELKYDSFQQNILYKIHHGKSDFSFLSDKFVKYMKGKKNNQK